MEFPEDIQAQLISELLPLMQHSDIYQYVTLVLLICLSIDKLIKKIYIIRGLWKTKYEMDSDKNLRSSDL